MTVGVNLVGERTRPACGGRRLRWTPLDQQALARNVSNGFGEGAEACTRGACAPRGIQSPTSSYDRRCPWYEAQPSPTVIDRRYKHTHTKLLTSFSSDSLSPSE
jgi:hypothetical protein